MNCFNQNFQFDDCNNFLELKKKYEIANNCILVIEDSHLLKGSNDFVTSIVYDRITLGCKSGKERPCKGRGIRASSTFKKQCPFKVLHNYTIFSRPSMCYHTDNHLML